jgi:hypothetical protein
MAIKIRKLEEAIKKLEEELLSKKAELAELMKVKPKEKKPKKQKEKLNILTTVSQAKKAYPTVFNNKKYPYIFKQYAENAIDFVVYEPDDFELEEDQEEEYEENEKMYEFLYQLIDAEGIDIIFSKLTKEPMGSRPKLSPVVFKHLMKEILPEYWYSVAENLTYNDQWNRKEY